MSAGRSAQLPFALRFESSDLGLGFLVGSAALSSIEKIYGSGSGGNGGECQDEGGDDGEAPEDTTAVVL